MTTHTVESPLGLLVLRESDGALAVLDWAAPGARPVPGRAAPGPLLAEAARQLAAYFARRLTRFDLPLSPEGTAFQRRVWDGLGEIPFGRTDTYGGLARRVASAPRAVGGACARNRLPVIVPCHRVLAAHGGLGGYSGRGGVAAKRFLLALEGAHA